MSSARQALYEASGCVHSESKLVCFLYMLMRDHVPVGAVGALMQEVDRPLEEFQFTNGWLAQYAKYVETQLLSKETDMDNKVERIAKVAHEVNRAYCESLGDMSQLPWEQAPDWQKTSAINGVKLHMERPDATPQESHEKWLEEKRATGWKYGPVKDAEKKEHPCFLPFEQLKESDKAKDFLFRAVVRQLKDF